MSEEKKYIYVLYTTADRIANRMNTASISNPLRAFFNEEDAIKEMEFLNNSNSRKIEGVFKIKEVLVNGKIRKDRLIYLIVETNFKIMTNGRKERATYLDTIIQRIGYTLKSKAYKSIEASDGSKLILNGFTDSSYLEDRVNRTYSDVISLSMSNKGFSYQDAFVQEVVIEGEKK